MKRSVFVAVLALLGLVAVARAAETLIPNLAERTDLWPRKVTVTTEISVPLVMQGKTVGQATVPAGSVLSLTKVEGDKVQLDFNGMPAITAASNTDVMARALQKLRQLDALNARPTAATSAAASSTAVAPPAGASPASAPPAPVAPSKVAKAVSGSLVGLKNDSLENFADNNLAGVQYYAIYFSASWCGPCRRFTPSLVKFYNEIKPKHPEFELIFASNDRSVADMQKYMQGDSMPWPALKPADVRNTPLIRALAGNGIPCLVFIDQDGKVLSHSYEGGQYVGPNKVMRDIAAKLGDKK